MSHAESLRSSGHPNIAEELQLGTRKEFPHFGFNPNLPVAYSQHKSAAPFLKWAMSDEDEHAAEPCPKAPGLW